MACNFCGGKLGFDVTTIKMGVSYRIFRLCPGEELPGGNWLPCPHEDAVGECFRYPRPSPNNPVSLQEDRKVRREAREAIQEEFRRVAAEERKRAEGGRDLPSIIRHYFALGGGKQPAPGLLPAIGLEVERRAEVKRQKLQESGVKPTEGMRAALAGAFSGGLPPPEEPGSWTEEEEDIFND